MKIYTKTGDAGETGLFGGQRVGKDAQRIAAYGTVDELCAVLGAAAAVTDHVVLRNIIERIQRDLFVLGADLATPLETERVSIPRITGDQVTWMEETIDTLEQGLPSLRNFILPGGSVAAAGLHHARTVCRRAEREMVGLSGREAINPENVVYINRLSDLLFVLAREANRLDGREDIPWKQP